MLETPHVFVGAAIAVAIPNPLIAIPLAFTSHFILEMVPHWNPHLNTETDKLGAPTKKSTVITAIDATTALISGCLIAYNALPNWTLALTIFFACFAAVLPDLMEGPYFFLHLKARWIKKWIFFQKSIQNDTGFVWGMLTQALVVVSVILWLKNK